MATAATREERAKTGIVGLDDILTGGWPVNRLYLVQGAPGAGKTTLGLQFLLAGAARGESVLYVTLSESRAEVNAVAESHGWSLDSIAVFEPKTSDADELGDADNTVFHPSEVELRETIKELLDEVSRVNPSRVVLDSLSELRLLAQTPLHYRRQILRLKRLFAGRAVTVLLLDDGTAPEGDAQLQSIAHGVLVLEQRPQEFGSERRRLRISKLRGLKFRGGHHDYRIESGGLIVFPRLVAAEHRADAITETASSGVDALDALLGGGLARGTSTLILGPSGTGKSSITLQLAVAAASRNERVSMFTFDEGRATMLARARALGLPLEAHIATGLVTVRQIDPAEIVPDEFVHLVRESVDRERHSMVVIDSLNGYLQAMPEERFLALQLHELLSYLALKGVLAVLVMTQSGVVGQSMSSPVDITYIADTLILLRYFESEGRMKKAISVVKKRTGFHEDTIREFALSASGLTVGQPLTSFRGVLTGVPVFTGAARELMGKDDDSART
jgi:circadian clock protein KaiC